MPDTIFYFLVKRRGVESDFLGVASRLSTLESRLRSVAREMGLSGYALLPN
jgi:hypothetical protein